MLMGGKPAPQAEMDQIRLVFAGTKLTVQDGKKSMDGSFKIDPAKKPRQIDLNLEGKTIEGIYAFRDGKLKICINEPGQPRPTEFKSPEGSKTVLILLKRAK